jgi:hypothetical protein
VTGTILAVVGDSHIGSTTALSLPKFVTDEGQEITASRAQEWLYANWLDYWEYVRGLAGIRGKHRRNRLVVVHMGDVVDGIHHGSTQILPNLEDQETMACEILRPLAAAADGGFFQIRGTEAHAGAGAQSEVRVSREIGARACEWELDLCIDGVLQNFAHHGRAGARPWTSGASGQAGEIALERALAGEPIPRLVWRAHRHSVDDSGQRVPGCRVIVTPAWQLKTAFAHKVAAGRRSDIGGMVAQGEAVDFSHSRYQAAPGMVRRITIE